MSAQRTWLRTIGLAMLTALAARAQEQAVGWEPATTCYSDGSDWLLIGAGTMVCYANWRCLRWFVEWRRSVAAKARITWPSLMAILAACAYIGIATESIVWIVVGLIAMPLMVPAAPLVAALPAGFGAVALLCAVVWIESYALVRLAEWLRALREPVRLGIVR